MMAWSAGGASSAWIGPAASAIARARQAGQRCIHAACVRAARLARSARPEGPGRVTLPLAAVLFLVGVGVVVDVAVLVAILAGLQVTALATLAAAALTALAAAALATALTAA